MRCPFCGYPESKVLDTRTLNEGSSIKRRRECLECQKRFTTFEVLESVQIVVVKKNGEKELFEAGASAVAKTPLDILQYLKKE